MEETNKLLAKLRKLKFYLDTMGKEGLENSTLIGLIKGKINRRKLWEMYLTRLDGGTCTRK